MNNKILENFFTSGWTFSENESDLKNKFHIWYNGKYFKRYTDTDTDRTLFVSSKYDFNLYFTDK